MKVLNKDYTFYLLHAWKTVGRSGIAKFVRSKVLEKKDYWYNVN